jgi:hypothetical protein
MALRDLPIVGQLFEKTICGVSFEKGGGVCVFDADGKECQPVDPPSGLQEILDVKTVTVVRVKGSECYWIYVDETWYYICV